jgi:hypothetical protein
MLLSFKNSRFTTAMTALAVSTALSSAAFATETEKTQVGKLKCEVDGGIGLLLGSKKKMACVFDKKDGSVENYVGRVTKIGVDIGITKESTILWAVFAPSGENDKGALAGKYTGVAAEATVVGGVGANALFSAGNNFTLQPFSVQGQVGLNIAGGLSQIKLEFVE